MVIGELTSQKAKDQKCVSKGAISGPRTASNPNLALVPFRIILRTLKEAARLGKFNKTVIIQQNKIKPDEKHEKSRYTSH